MGFGPKKGKRKTNTQILVQKRPRQEEVVVSLSVVPAPQVNDPCLPLRGKLSSGFVHKMSLQRTIATLHQRAAVGPISLAYKRRVISERFRLDGEQLLLSSKLDDLYFSLSSSSSSSSFFHCIPDHHIETIAKYYGGALNLSTNNIAAIALATAHSLVNFSTPKGVYIHGSVGVGKSMMMDLFYSMCANGLSIPEEDVDFLPIERSHKRYHFHEFMLDIHKRIHEHKINHPRSDPIPSVAASLAKEARLLCFDEMQVTDIADAMIMKRLFTILFDLGIVIVTTSNRPPSGLYEGGINRSVFLPFIETLKNRMLVIRMEGTHDYRKDGSSHPSHNYSSSSLSLPTFLCPSDDPATQSILEQWFSKDGDNGGETRSETIPVIMGRSVHVKRANANCGWFTFNELCKQPLGAADYLAIAHRFDLIIVEHVPQLCGNTYNEARRFVTLIDALYEARTKLIISADVSRKNLFLGFDAIVETNDGDEEIAIVKKDTLGMESFVVGEGGSSSSSSTTMINNAPHGKQTVEWSATGRIGVSLAQLSAVREVSYSFMRAESRLAEMAAPNWGG